MKNSKMIKVLSGCALTAMLMAGCAEEASVTISEKPAAETKQTEAPKEVKEEKKAPKIGTRSNPVKLNEVATIDTLTYDDQSNSYKTVIDLTILEVIRGNQAQQMLKKMNTFNEDAPEGYEWALIKAKAKVKESETQDHAFYIDGIMDFEAVSENGDVYSGDIVGTNEPDFAFEMYDGSEKEGYISKLVKTGENAQLQYDPMISGSVFFNLQ